MMLLLWFCVDSEFGCEFTGFVMDFAGKKYGDEICREVFYSVIVCTCIWMSLP